MTYDEAKQVIKDIKYKDNFTIELFCDNFFCVSDYALRITMLVPERETKATVDINLIEQFRKDFIDNISPFEFVQYIRKCIHNLELHESDEQFRYKDEIVFDPHSKRVWQAVKLELP